MSRAWQGDRGPSPIAVRRALRLAARLATCAALLAGALACGAPARDARSAASNASVASAPSAAPGASVASAPSAAPASSPAGPEAGAAPALEVFAGTQTTDGGLMRLRASVRNPLPGTVEGVRLVLRIYPDSSPGARELERQQRELGVTLASGATTAISWDVQAATPSARARSASRPTRAATTAATSRRRRAGARADGRCRIDCAGAEVASAPRAPPAVRQLAIYAYFGICIICMRTSIDIPDNLLRRARHLARTRGTTLREVFLEGLRSVVDRPRKERSPHRVEDCSFGGDGLVEGLSWSDTDRLRELIYEGRGG